MKSLLEKVPADLISLNQNQIAEIDVESLEVRNYNLLSGNNLEMPIFYYLKSTACKCHALIFIYYCYRKRLLNVTKFCLLNRHKLILSQGQNQKEKVEQQKYFT